MNGFIKPIPGFLAMRNKSFRNVGKTELKCCNKNLYEGIDSRVEESWWFSVVFNIIDILILGSSLR